VVASITGPETAPTGGSVDADFSVMAPSRIQPGRSFVVELWVAQTRDRDKMLAEATRSGRMIERGHRSHVQINRDTLFITAEDAFRKQSG